MNVPNWKEKKFPPPKQASSDESYIRRSAEIPRKKLPCDLKIQIHSNASEIEEKQPSPQKRQKTTIDEKNGIYSELETPRNINFYEQQMRLMKSEKELQQSFFLIKEKQKRIDILCQIIKGKNSQIQEKNKREQFLLESQKKLNQKFIEEKQKLSKLMLEYDQVAQEKNLYCSENESLKKINKVLKEQLEVISQQNPETQDCQSAVYQGFEEKINKLIEEKYELQNKINKMYSTIEENEFKISSLKITLEAYEQRENQQQQSYLMQQIQILRKKVEQLEEKNKKMQEDHEYEIMKLQNEIDEIRQNREKKSDNTSLNQILKDQITQIEFLRQKIREVEKS